MQDINPMNFTLDDIKNLEISLSFTSILVSMLVSGLCAEIVAQTYNKYAYTLGNRESFSRIFWLLAIITTIVISVVKYSLALSLGLVGALSIVRFRAAIKEPEELVYLFLIIAIGLGAGSGQYPATVTLTLLSVIYIIIKAKRRPGNRKGVLNYTDDAYFLTLKVDNTSQEVMPSILERALPKLSYELFKIEFFQNEIEYVYKISKGAASESNLKDLSSELVRESIDFSLARSFKLAP